MNWKKALDKQYRREWEEANERSRRKRELIKGMAELGIQYDHANSSNERPVWRFVDRLSAGTVSFGTWLEVERWFATLDVPAEFLHRA